MRVNLNYAVYYVSQTEKIYKGCQLLTLRLRLVKLQSKQSRERVTRRKCQVNLPGFGIQFFEEKYYHFVTDFDGDNGTN